MKKICLMLVFCLLLAVCSAAAGETADAAALLDQAEAAMAAENYEEMVSLLQQAADLGDDKAMLMLGNCYGEGRGVEMNFEEAVKYYRKGKRFGEV
jgi:hypothetical protein